MPTPEQAREALALITATAVAEAGELVTLDARGTRDRLLVAAPDLIAYYSDGSAALAADHYDDLREAANPPGLYRAEPVVNLREENIRRGVLWSVTPLYGADPDQALAVARLSEVVQYETANPFRDTITTNTRRDPAARGWQRVTSGVSCTFCTMLADRGPVYSADTAHFATHPGCDCSAAPAFTEGPRPSAEQLAASSN